MRSPFWGAVFALVFAAWPAMANDVLPELVNPLRCLAGEWGKSARVEWRVQLGVFDDRDVAERFAARLRAKGLPVDEYVAASLARGDREPIVVVSGAQTSRRAAARVAKRFAAAAPGAFVRRYKVWY